jgi:hypothetical protein
MDAWLFQNNKRVGEIARFAGENEEKIIVPIGRSLPLKAGDVFQIVVEGIPTVAPGIEHFIKYADVSDRHHIEITSASNQHGRSVCRCIYLRHENA